MRRLPCWPVGLSVRKMLGMLALGPASFSINPQMALATVLIQGPDTPALEYRAALKADPDLLAPSQFLLRQRPAAAQREALLSAFAAAQKSFLENSKEQAQLRFQEVVVMFTAEDWARADRQIFLHSFLRLAQMQLEADKQDQFLLQAVATGADVSAESGLFPPPLLKALSRLRRDVPRVQVPDFIFADGWSTVLVNGVPCTRQSCPGFPLHVPSLRITYLSEVWQTVVATAAPSELKSIRPKKSAWVTGDCTKSQYSPAGAALKESRVFWGLTCEALPAKIVNLNPVSQINSATQNPPGRSDELPRMEIKESAPAFYKSKWLWGGVAAGVIVAIIVNGQKKPKDQREPTTTYGHE